MTHNLPASIESATSAIDQLADHTIEIADVLAMAFGLPFAQMPHPDSRYGTVTASVERLAGSLDAVAKSAEAASARLLGLARPIQLDRRPEAIAEPCQCQPAPETLTIPPEADPEEAAHEAAMNWTPSESSDDDQKKTDDRLSGESVIFRPPVMHRTEQQIAEPEPVINQPRRRSGKKK